MFMNTYISGSKFGSIDTPNGQVKFVEFIGVTNDELIAVKDKHLDVETLYQKLGNDVTDYHRESVI